MTEALDPYTFGPEQLCFGCGPHNDHGLRLHFERQGEEIVTRYRPRPGQEGPPGFLHGGLQATLADELAAWTIIGLRGRMGFTSSLDVRLLRPARMELELEGRGSILKEAGKITVVKVQFSQEGKKTLTGRVSYMIPTVEEAEKVLGRTLPEAWRRFAMP
jgi:uncharacterized protein (TIGR00369 family)